MACRICNRSSCTESFHSLDEQNEVLDAPESTARIRELEQENAALKHAIIESELCPAELRRIAQNERLVSAHQRGEAADALDWAAREIERLERKQEDLDYTIRRINEEN